MHSAEARTLLRACALPHLKLFVEIALHTGARRGAILDLTWPQVDMIGRKINFLKPRARQTRKRQPIVPINADLLAALKAAQKKAKGLYVVNWHGEKIRSVRRAFGDAVAAAKLKSDGRDAVTPHILRHTFATWAAQDGVPIHQIAGALGLTQKTAIEIYGHHHPDYMKDAGRAVAARLRATGT